MKRTMNVIGLILVLVLGLLLVSCSGRAEPDGTSREESPAETSSEAPVTQAPGESTQTEAADTSEAETAAEPVTEESEPALPEGEEIYPTAGIPTLEILIDESRGTIDAMKNDPDHETRCYGEIRIDIPAGYQCEYGGKVYQEATSETYALDYIRGRGNSTWGRDKKPYKIKLDKKADLLGMGEEKNWALLANYYDCTMLRNKLTYKLGERFFPEGTFVPQNVFVNVKMNGEYLGLYCLSESVRLSKERVDVEEPSSEPDAKDEALVGGYLLTNDDMGSSAAIIRTNRAMFLVDTPEEVTERQQEYLTGFLQKVEDSICRPERLTDGTTYEDLMDVDSYIDFFLIQEMSANGDGFKSDSTYYFQDRNGKLVFGPLWDFDYVAWSGDLEKPEGYVTLEYAPWMNVLLQDESFRAKLIARWEELKPLLISMAEEGGWLDRYAEAIKEDRIKNYETASTFLWEEPELAGERDEDDEEYEPKESLTEEEIAERKKTYSYEAELKRLKDWILQRTEWMDQNIRDIRSEWSHLEFMDGETMVRYQPLKAGEDLEEDLVPVPEKKEGYRFTGWVRTDEKGEKVPLSLQDPTALQTDPIVYQAEWEAYDPEADLKGLAFSEEVFYCDSMAYVELGGLLSTVPFDFDKGYLEFTVECEPEDCGYPSDDSISFVGEGEARVTVSCGDQKASCRIITEEEEKLVAPKDYDVPESMTLKAGECGFIRMTPAKDAMTLLKRDSEKPVFEAEDPQIAEIDANGYVHALQAGTTKVTITDEELGKTWSLTLTVE